jgi:hypothetical protein
MYFYYLGPLEKVFDISMVVIVGRHVLYKCMKIYAVP